MRVIVNGRDLTERTESLGEKEKHYFEVIKSAVYCIVGAIAIICLPGVFHFIASLPIDFGADSVINSFKILR
ncbi:hypothetical protein [Paenibacillus sp. NRS-1760]|uniref:hypothetical protein n=1 Tax=Paenibacillus sp. NRS-1760 TaxID=3233902 RepID=UPI003D2875BF